MQEPNIKQAKNKYHRQEIRLAAINNVAVLAEDSVYTLETTKLSCRGGMASSSKVKLRLYQ